MNRMKGLVYRLIGRQPKIINLAVFDVTSKLIIYYSSICRQLQLFTENWFAASSFNRLYFYWVVNINLKQ